MTTMNINATINNINTTEIEVLNAIFGDRITITINEAIKEAPKKPGRPKKVVETPKAEAVGADALKAETPKTRAQGIAEWRIKKYGSAEKVEAIDAMAKVIAEEWRQKAIETGKLVVRRSEYKHRLYEEAERRVNEVEAAKAETEKAAKAAKAAKATTATTATTAKTTKAPKAPKTTKTTKR